MSKKSNPLIRLDIKEFKNTVTNGNEASLPDKFILSKLFTPEITLVTDLSDEEKALMKESGSDTMIEFVISTGGVDRDGDTIAVDGWSLKNFRKNPVVPWVHNYGEPPVARAIGTKVRDGSLVSKAIFTGEELYPFGHMIGKMYEQKFLNAVSVGFNPSKFVFVEDTDRKFGIDFLKQDLLEYSAVPVPSNPNALQQARSVGIDTTPMIEWAEKILDGDNYNSLFPRNIVEEIRKSADSKGRVTVWMNDGNIIVEVDDSEEDKTDENGKDKTKVQDSSDDDGDSKLGDDENIGKDDIKNTHPLDNKQVEKEVPEIEHPIGEDSSLEDCIECSKDLLSGEVVAEDIDRVYSQLKDILESKFSIDIFDFKYVDSKVLKNFPERFSFDEKKGLLIEKTQKGIDNEIIKTNVEVIREALITIKRIEPDFKLGDKYEEKVYNKDQVLEIDESCFNKDSKSNSDSENVITLEDIDNVDDLRSLLKKGAKESTEVTFNKITGKLD